MNPYSFQFGIFADVSGGLYIPVPADETWIIRDIDMVAPSAFLQTYEAAVGQLSGTDVASFVPFASLVAVNPPNLTTVSWRGRQVLAFGENLGFFFYDGEPYLSVSGYRLSGAPLPVIEPIPL